MQPDPSYDPVPDLAALLRVLCWGAAIGPAYPGGRPQACAAPIDAELSAERAAEIRARYAGVSGPEAVRLGLEIAARAGPPATPARRTPATVAQPSPSLPDVASPLTARAAGRLDDRT